MSIFATQSERAAVREYLVNISATGAASAADAVNKLLSKPLKLWQAENRIARLMRDDGPLQAKLSATTGDVEGAFQDLLQWLLDNSDKIIEIIMRIIGMFS